MNIDYQSINGLELRAVDFVQKQLPPEAHEKRTLKELFIDIHTRAMFSLLSKETYTSKPEFSWKIIRPFLRVSVDQVHMSNTVAMLTNLVEVIEPDVSSAVFMAYDMMGKNGLARHAIAVSLFEKILKSALGNQSASLEDRETLSRDVLAFLKQYPNGLQGSANARKRTSIMNMALETLGRDKIACTGVTIDPPVRQKFVWPKANVA